MYNSTLSLNKALDGVGDHAPAALLPRKVRYPSYSKLGGPPGPVWMGEENFKRQAS
jgi:hypothetical protein